MLKPSSFTSIFELIAGFCFAYAGLSMVANYVNSQFYKKSFNLSKRGKQMESMLTDSVDIEASKAVQKLTQKFKNLTIKKDFLERARKKMIPIYTFGGFFCFFILLFAGISDADISSNLQGIIQNRFGDYRGLVWGTVFWLDILSIYFVFHLFFRRKSGENKYTTFRIFLYLNLIFAVSIILTVIFQLFFQFNFLVLTFFGQLFLFYLTLTISLSPILLSILWVYGGFGLEWDAIDSINRDLNIFITSKKIKRLTTVTEIERLRIQSLFTNVSDGSIDSEYRSRIRKGIYPKYKTQIRVTTLCIIAVFVVMFLPIDMNEIMENKFSDNTLTKSKIENFIQLAGRTEIECYKNCHKPDTLILNKFFTANGEAKKKIINVLEDRGKDSLVITNQNNPSLFKFYKVIDIKTENNRLFVSTSEFWHLKWYNPKRKTYVYEFQNRIHEGVNYELVVEKGELKIDVSDYVGQRTNYL